MVRHQPLHFKKATVVPLDPRPNFLCNSLTYTIHWRYGAIESRGGWRIVFDAMRLFFKTMWAIRFCFRDDAVFAIGEAIKVDRIVGGSGKMNL